MKYIELQNKVAELEGNYFAELDRVKVNSEYAQKNRVHVFQEGKNEEVAKIIEDKTGAYMIFEDVPEELVELIKEYSNTPIEEREADDLSAQDSDVNFKW